MLSVSVILQIRENYFGVPSDHLYLHACLGHDQAEPQVDHLLVAPVDGDVQFVHELGDRSVEDCRAGVVPYYLQPGLRAVVESRHEVVGYV